MDSQRFSDGARQGVNVAAALFQVIVTARAAAGITAVTDPGGPPPLIEPAGYAFAIWGVIFALSLVYAGFQALPAQRANPLLRRIGWWTALAFACTGLWSVFVPRRELALAQLMLLVMGVSLGIALFGVIAEARRRPLTSGERWAIALPLAPFFGWMTAANPVSLYSFFTGPESPLANGTLGSEVLGAGLLILTGAFAALVTRAAKAGPPQAYLGYAATIVWAVVGIIVNQAGTSPVIVAAAVLAGLPVVAALLLPPPGPPAPAGLRTMGAEGA
jgi:hypothetical protein